MARTRTTTVVEPAPLTRQAILARVLLMALSIGTAYLGGRAQEKGKADQAKRVVRAAARKQEERDRERHTLGRVSS